MYIVIQYVRLPTPLYFATQLAWQFTNGANGLIYLSLNSFLRNEVLRLIKWQKLSKPVAVEISLEMFPEDIQLINVGASGDPADHHHTRGQSLAEVFRIVPDTKEQLEVLKDLVDNADVYDLDFWKSPTKTGVSTDVMIPSTTLKNITDLLSSSNISYVVSVPDVVRLMKEYETPKDSGISDLLRSFYRRFKDDGVATNKATYNFDDYGSYSDMVNWMTKIQEYYPSFTKVIQIGTTHEGRSIVGIKIGNHISNQNKRVVWIDGGIHAREWASIHTALYFINELVGKYGSDPDITHYVNSLNFYIIPCVNPDGYVYSFAAKDNPRQRLWRKNRSKPVCPSSLSAGQNPAEKCCQGVDLNRNFGFHWAEPGSNSNPCSLIYQGHSAFSEPETRAVRDMLLSPELYGKVDAFITMHTYSQLWIYPWGHHENSYPADIVDLKTVAENAVRALESTYGTKYKSGTGADILSFCVILCCSCLESSLSSQSGPILRRIRAAGANAEAPQMKAEFNFRDYATYAQMKHWMKNIEFYYPNFTKNFQIGTTSEGQAIHGIKIGTPTKAQKKRAIWIDGGIHAREWAAINTALYFINELVAKYGVNDEITYYVDTLDFYIVPCLNPDGYEYAHTRTADPLSFRRMWRKNRSKENCIDIENGGKSCCKGVDLNRNFDIHWGLETRDPTTSGNTTSIDPCSDIYQGPRAFSEPETRALRDILLSPELKGRTDAYITLHTFGQIWMYPFGHQKGVYPDDKNDLESVGRAAVAALAKAFGTKYRLGNNPAPGSSVDWAKGVAGIKYAYLIELRPPPIRLTGFILQKAQLIPCAIETWEGVKVVVDAILKLHNLQRKTTTLVDASKPNGNKTNAITPLATTSARHMTKN
uniref:Peptidase M14 carboxypeptidase A domain-containing protein n=1 Tax=Plectus sambesii TaxID=2011161 RepID=A0A914UMW2_9BILA